MDNRTILLEGWELEDNQGNVFVFPDFDIKPDQSCRIYTGETLRFQLWLKSGYLGE